MHRSFLLLKCDIDADEMSTTHEESLLSHSFTVDEAHEEESTPVSSLLYEQQHEKFGISNVDEDVGDTNHPIREISQNASVDSQSISSSVSSYSTSGRTTSHHHYNSFSDQRDLSDAEVFHPCSESSYSTIEDKNRKHSLASTGSSQHQQEKNVSNIASSPVITHQRHASHEWVTFDEVKACVNGNGAGLSKGASKPPDIPSRRQISSSGQKNTVDLLSMDPDTLSIHLVNSSISPTNQVPPIPERLHSNQRILSASSSSSSQSPVSSNFSIRLPPPPPPATMGSLKRKKHSRSVSSTPSKSDVLHSGSQGYIAGPPVPPRKDIPDKRLELGSASDTADMSDTSSLHGWIKFDRPGSSHDELIDSGSLHTNTVSTTSQLVVADSFQSSFSSVNESSATPQPSDELKDETDDAKWVSSTPPESPKSSKKKKRGYQHLSSSSDEAETVKQQTGDGITIQVTDLSPIKPLSRWQPIPNEGEDHVASSGNASSQNSVGGVDGNDDLDIDDVFGVNLNRLSADVSGLKGFNRADRGSQNNLVDFSELAEKSSRSSQCGDESSDNEVEVVFDMTAQGDSLKRKRRKNQTFSDNTSHSTQLSQVESPRPASAAETVTSMEQIDLSKICSKPSNLSTNPFCNQSPLGDTISLTSSTSETNPFERVQFQTSAPSGPAPLSKPAPSSFPTLPPPPKSTKSRPGSVGRRRSQNTSVSTPISPLKCVDESEDNNLHGNTVSSNKATKISTFDDNPSKSDAVSLLDLAEEGHVSNNHPTNVQVDDTSSVSFLGEGFEAGETNNPASSSKTKDATIIAPTLAILDVLSKSPESKTPPTRTDDSDVKTCQALQMVPAYPDLRENSIESFEKLQQAISAGNVGSTNFETVLVKKVSRLKERKVIAKEWKMQMRFPRQKRMMSSRKWVEIYVRLKTDKVDHPMLQLYHNQSTVDPFFFIDLSKHDWQISQPKLQRINRSLTKSKHKGPGHAIQTSTDTEKVNLYGEKKRKLHTIKLFQVCYKEKRAFSSKHDKYVTRTPFGFKHSLKTKQVAKLGTENYSEFLSFLFAITDSSFNSNRLTHVEDEDDHRPNVKYHSRNEIVLELKDNFSGIISTSGVIEACDVTVDLHVTSFLSGDPMASVTFNDKKVQGKEVVRRADIVPSSNNNWVAVEDMEVHRCSPRGYDDQTAAITFYPPDACRFQLARFSCPYTEREPPVTVKASITVKGCKVMLRCVIRSSTVHSANQDPLTQVPCDDLSLRFALPDAWVPAFRKYEMGAYRSLHADRVARRPSTKRVLGGRGVFTYHATMEASVGSAKYEAAFGSVVWRVKRFPEKNAAQNTPHVFACSLQLESNRELPREGAGEPYRSCQVEYSMPSSTASNACIRSINLPNCERAEKFTTYSSHYLYSVGVSVTHEPDVSDQGSHSCAVQ